MWADQMLEQKRFLVVPRRFIYLLGALVLVFVFAASAAAQEMQEVQEARLQELSGQVRKLYAEGKYDEAVVVAQEFLRIAETAFGPEHAHTATALNNLAQLYQAQGKYAEAEQLFQRSLAIREKVLGPEHADVAVSLNNLASLDSRISAGLRSHTGAISTRVTARCPREGRPQDRH